MKQLKKYFIRKLGLKGSWSWAKKKMRSGYMVRCKHWSGSLILSISAETMLLNGFTRDLSNIKWETSNHFLSYEDFTDYEAIEPIK